VAQEIIKFAQENDANSVVTINSPSSGFEEICGQLEKYLELEVFEV
jgi:hypothetical protein